MKLQQHVTPLPFNLTDIWYVFSYFLVDIAYLKAKILIKIKIANECLPFKDL